MNEIYNYHRCNRDVFGRKAVSYTYINSYNNNNMKSTNSTSRRKHKNHKNVVVCGEWFLVMDP